ncbi:MAG: neutral zinc metallopeptidase [Gemmatimonadota bacterium]
MVKWRSARRSGRVEDRRGMGARGLVGGGIGTLVVIVGALLLGVDPRPLLEGEGGAPPTQQEIVPGSPEDSAGAFVDAILGDTEQTWTALFASSGNRYEPTTVVLFTNAVQSACGTGQAAMGPFYCPLDRKVYLDLSFFRALDERFGAPGDFARAYVIAHEVGHHVQTLTGISDEVRRAQEQVGATRGAGLSMAMELQADCYAGVWGHHAEEGRDLLEAGDVEEGLAAAAAIGDDRLQRQSGGEVRPETFTHGTSAQRVQWFRRGLETGDPAACDAFAEAG